MTSKFNKFYAQSLKLKAASADPYFKKKAILVDKINKINDEFEMKKQQALQKLNEELTLVQTGIDAIDNIVKAETGGFGIEDLCYKEGKKWLLKYPETVVPMEAEKCDDACDNMQGDAEPSEMPENPVINPFNN